MNTSAQTEHALPQYAKNDAAFKNACGILLNAVKYIDEPTEPFFEAKIRSINYVIEQGEVTEMPDLPKALQTMLDDAEKAASENHNATYEGSLDGVKTAVSLIRKVLDLSK